MVKKRTYLDYNASAKLHPDAREALLMALDANANASSVHADGRDARAMIERARVNVASLVGANPDQVIFTSGATEAAQLALSSILRRGKDMLRLDRLYVSAIEHPCILSGGRFGEDQITVFPVTSDGVVDIAAFAAMLAARACDTPFLAALMLANNETGIIQPVSEVAQLVHDAGGFLLVDAVQAAGRLPVDMAELGADFLILSSHKIAGPQGAGALVLGDKNLAPEPLIKGGGQEFKLRAGTENLVSVAGFGAASLVAASQLDYMQKTLYIRQAFEKRLAEICKQFAGAKSPLVIFGKEMRRLANTTCFSVPGVNAETALISLDLDGISVSSGSACSSGRVEASHVLKAMGVDNKTAQGALRISTGWDTGPADLEVFLEAWSSYLKRLT